MGNYKCEIELKQYTPMVHFQSDEPGACLRASEVKPKLDKYVLAWLNKHNITSANLPVNWCNVQGNQASIALRYKMRFLAKKNEKLEEGHPSFFGNQGNRNHQTSLLWNEIVNMTVICLTDIKIRVALPGQDEKECTLLEILKALIPAFFATHCFGMRSNKGFGSFGVERIDKSSEFPKSVMTQELLPSECEQAFFMSYKQQTNDSLLLLDDIYIISSLMKGGVNQQHFQSQLHQAVHMSSRYDCASNDEDRASEKAFIIREVFNQSEREKYNKILRAGYRVKQIPSTTRYYYYRALLGLAGNYSFFGRDRSNMSRILKIDSIKVVAKDESEQNLTINQLTKKRKIGRFPNPVVFKPSPDGLLILLQNIPEPLKKASFIFRNDAHQLTLPNFNLELFVEDCLFSYVDSNYAKRWKNWNAVKSTKIYKRNTEYGARMNNFSSVTTIVQKATEDEGRK